MKKITGLGPGIASLLILATAFWAPAIFAHKTIIHGDFLGHGLPLMDLQSRSFRDLGALLWQNKVYGGHPLFAEGQGGYAHPMNMLFAWVVAPLFGSIAAENLFHWSCMLIGGLGILLLCRRLGLGAWSSCFGAVAGVFSLYNIGQQENQTVSAAGAWVPWCIWAIERWLARPRLESAALLALMLTLEFFCGYPEMLDGVLLYGLAMIAARLFDRGAREGWGRNGRVLIVTGAAAALITIGLSAVQLLPEIELVQLSHRSGGIEMPIQLPLVAFLRGFLFTRWGDAGLDYYPVVGSILICMLASLTLVLRTTTAVKGHIAGTLLLIFLGMGQATALFRFIYDHDLLPQLHFYRLVFLYLDDANVTIAALAAVAVDAAGRWAARSEGRRLLFGRPPAWVLIGFLLLWAWAVYWLWLPGALIVQYRVAAVGILAIAVLPALKAARWLPLVLTALVVVEVATTKLFFFHFADSALLARPGSVAVIQAEPDWRDYRIYSDNRVGLYAFMPPNSPGLEQAVQRALPSVAGMANLLWDLPSVDGALALGLARRWAIEPRLEGEVFGRVGQPPGARLIDLLSIRWSVFQDPALAPAAHVLWHERPDDFWIVQNDAARPRFQVYAGCRRAGSSAEALEMLSGLSEPTLVIEDQGPVDPCDAPLAMDATPPARFTVLKDRSTRYRFAVSADRPAWFFVADANYPGWRAYLDGRRVPLYSAQILGKAVAVPPGKHELQLRFRSDTFLAGLAVTLLTLGATAALLIRRRRPAKIR